MSPDPLYYQYDADQHCARCARERFEPAVAGNGRQLPYLTGVDGEGNPITPVYDWEDTDSDHDFDTGPRVECCGTCGRIILAVTEPGGLLQVSLLSTYDELVKEWQERREAKAELEADDEPPTEIIHAYSRAQALKDGGLVAVPASTAKEAGFTLPLAVTAAVEAMLRNIPDRFAGEDYEGRLWDVLWMASLEARKPRNADEHTIAFKVILHDSDAAPTDDSARSPHLHTLYLTIGPGDTPEPVLTIQTSMDL